MELPNRKQLRDMIIQRVKGRRNANEQSKANICSKYALKRVYNTLTSKSSTYKVVKEWVEHIDKEDERHEKLFYRRKGIKMGIAARAKRPPPYETVLPEPKEKQTKVKYDSLDYVIVENQPNDLGFARVWARTGKSQRDKRAIFFQPDWYGWFPFSEIRNYKFYMS